MSFEFRFRVSCSGFRISDSWVEGVGRRFQGSEVRVPSSELGVKGSGFKIQKSESESTDASPTVGCRV